MKATADKTLLVLTAVCVAGLAIAAGAISFAHMRELATHHEQLGWKSYAFPISVDGLEIVASLYLVAQRRAGRPTGWIPWAALTVGTLGSLAANVAVGGTDPIGKALAGWPALSMLVSVKLLFSMLDHESHEQQRIVPDDQRTAGTTDHAGRYGTVAAGTVRGEGTNAATPSGTGAADRTAERITDEAGQRAANGTEQSSRATQLDLCVVAHLIPTARAARTALATDGRSLSRDNLANAMRDAGHGVSNGRASLLLKILKAEEEVTMIDSTSTKPDRENRNGSSAALGRNSLPLGSEALEGTV